LKIIFGTIQKNTVKIIVIVRKMYRTEFHTRYVVCVGIEKLLSIHRRRSDMKKVDRRTKAYKQGFEDGVNSERNKMYVVDIDQFYFARKNNHLLDNVKQK
jgi:hypothetical protein